MSAVRRYFDNSATTFPKPPGVSEAVTRFLDTVGGSPGRGSYAESFGSRRLISDCRKVICELIGGLESDQLIFTQNGSESLNLAIKGLLDPCDDVAHVICTTMDHNSIGRPLAAMASRGRVSISRISVDLLTGLIDPIEVRNAIRSTTRLIAITHVSNVTGVVQPLGEIGQIARAADVPFLVDAAQSAGHVAIDVEADKIDLLAAPGHKSLMGPLGTGFLYIRPGLEGKMRPLKEGGTGSAGEDERQPEFMPDKFESGSQNVPGIAGLLAGVRWVKEQTVARLHAHDQRLVRAFLDKLNQCDGVTLYGPPRINHRIGVFSVRVAGWGPQELSAVLESHYGILTRSGLHCAPHTHKGMGTADGGGTTRLSFGPFLTEADVAFAASALCEIADANPCGA